jgi:hypothetical protein
MSDDSVVSADYKRMEPLWSPVVANGGNPSQIGRPRKPRKQAETVAVGCDQLPIEAHGKEGVDGSSPSEGFDKNPANQTFVLPARRTLGHISDTFLVPATRRDVSRRRATHAPRPEVTAWFDEIPA